MPASLIGNWQKEIDRFAPKMSYQVLHGSTARKDADRLVDKENFLTIITYGMAVRLEQLRNIKWDLIILDEAQAIKNPSTKQTKTINSLQGTSKIALTGTPIENHLSDLWSF